MSLLLGLDGCRGGWMLACWRPDEGLTFQLSPVWPAALVAGAAEVAVDMPIGLPDGGRRGCDLAARAALPHGAKSRVFIDLRRPLLGFADYPAANAWAKAEGHGLSKQAWFLLPKIAEIDRQLAPADQARVVEGHPELVLHHLNGGRLLANKTTAEGRARRLALLADAGLDGLAPWLARFPRAQAKPDDVIDAAARPVIEGQPGAVIFDPFGGAVGCCCRGTTPG